MTHQKSDLHKQSCKVTKMPDEPTTMNKYLLMETMIRKTQITHPLLDATALRAVIKLNLQSVCSPALYEAVDLMTKDKQPQITRELSNDGNVTIVYNIEDHQMASVKITLLPNDVDLLKAELKTPTNNPIKLSNALVQIRGTQLFVETDSIEFSMKLQSLVELFA